jgi:hypothetical protein
LAPLRGCADVRRAVAAARSGTTALAIEFRRMGATPLVAELERTVDRLEDLAGSGAPRRRGVA